MPPETDLTDSASLPEGALKAFPTPGGGPQVLLTRQQGRVHAFAPNCPHYGAPLEKGKVVNGRLVCPWHHACFGVENGHLCEPPALDDLPAYPVRESGGRLLVQVPARPPASTDKPDATPTAEVGGTPPPAVPVPVDTRVFVVVGGGAAGEYAAQTLRREGFAGRLVLVSADAERPYDRTKLSKVYLAGKAGPAALPLREADFYPGQKVEVLTGATATGLDLKAQEISFDTQPPLRYDQLLLAPGSTPNTLPTLPGHDLPGVFRLRTQADAAALLAAAQPARQVVVIGSSFIGMEAAGSLIGEGRAVTVVSQDQVPFEKVLGPEIGAMFRRLHEEKGVAFEAGAEVAELTAEAGRVAGVKLQGGRTLPADLVVLGVGVRPATEWLRPALPLGKDGGVVVDEFLQAAPGVYAAGDVARFPLAGAAGTARIEHWRLAQQHGRTAARNMLGQREPFAAVPFFWTQQYGKSLRYVGHAAGWDAIRYLGDVAKQEFLALYVTAGQVVAVAGMGRDADLIFISELLSQQKMPAPAAIDEHTDWAALLG